MCKYICSRHQVIKKTALSLEMKAARMIVGAIGDIYLTNTLQKALITFFLLCYIVMSILVISRKREM